MNRTPEQAQRMRDRRSARKMENLAYGQNFAVKTAGKSLRMIMQDELDEKMKEWQQLDYTNRDRKVRLRGEIRGLAIALAILMRPYDDKVSVAKKIEKYSLRRINA